MEINGKNYELKYSLRSMFIWEEMVGKPFEIKTLFDTYCFCFSCIIANPDNPGLEFNEFIDACDENPLLIQEFNDFLAKEMSSRSTTDDKKKVRKKN